VREFAKLGLTRSVGGVLALALARELTPVVTSIILAGRVGSAFAAELGTMQASSCHEVVGRQRLESIQGVRACFIVVKPCVRVIVVCCRRLLFMTPAHFPTLRHHLRAQVSEQVDSLRVLATDPVDYLVTPRVLASMLAGPILNVLCFCMGRSPWWRVV
jgi:hypothetical protein